MRNVIKKLAQAKAGIKDTHFFSRGATEAILDEVVRLIDEAIAELEPPPLLYPGAAGGGDGKTVAG
jgi:hypothetical protein